MSFGNNFILRVMKRNAYWMLFVLILILIAFGIVFKYNFPKSKNQDKNRNLNTDQAAIHKDSLRNLFHSGIDTSIIINGETYHLKDLSNRFNFLVTKTDSSVQINKYGNNYTQWQHFLTKPHPSGETVRKYFNEASKEFGIPLPILEAIGKIENNWTQIGPSIDQGWGIMHLVKNDYCNTLDEAAKLLNLSPEILKEDASQNIRGAAALLRKYAGSESETFITYEQWVPAFMKFSGLIDEELQSLKAAKYLNLIYTGSESVTLWGDTIILNPHAKNY